MDVLIWLARLLGWMLRLAWRGLSALLGAAPAAKGRKGTFGSARWASRFSQLWRGVLTRPGVILGRGAWRRLVRFSTDGLVMVFAATGAGKGLGIVIPTLLTYPGSMVVTDPKGENFAVTSRHRRTYGKVVMLNPTNLLASARFNPMDIIRHGTDKEATDARALASLMVMPADGDDNHWDSKAVSMLTALLLHTLQEPPPSRTLAHVRRLSVGSPEIFTATINEIAFASPSLAAREIASGILTTAYGRDGTLTPEFASIISTLQKATEIWSAGYPAGILSASSTFTLDDLVNEPTTLYLCVDEDVLDVYGPWLRVIVGCTLKILTRAKQRAPKRKVMLMLDEVAVLGRLDALEKQSGLLRAYCMPVLIWQNLPQIFKVYGSGAKAFLANASARVFFGIGDNDTAAYVATMLGQAPILTSSVSTSHQGWGDEHRSESQGQAGYWLLDTAELQSLSLKTVIIKHRKVPHPILARRIDYRWVLRWHRRWDRWRRGDPPATTTPPTPPLDEAPPPSRSMRPPASPADHSAPRVTG
jgi:type IV secretion system protein VirD4